MTTPPVVSIVLPARNEGACLGSLLMEIARTLAYVSYEIIVVDDGSTDNTVAVVSGLMAQIPHLHLICHQTSCGQSAALRTGIRAAQGALIATLDADGQNPPENLPLLISPFLAPSRPKRLGLVQGQRKVRQDSWSRRFASKFANDIRGRVLGDGVTDSGCGMKAFPRELYRELAYFDHIHRFMPAMVRREGYDVMTVEVTHHPRTGGQSNYRNGKRLWVGIIDLIGVAWLIKRRNLPVAHIYPQANVFQPSLPIGDRDPGHLHTVLSLCGQGANS